MEILELADWYCKHTVFYMFLTVFQYILYRDCMRHRLQPPFSHQDHKFLHLLQILYSEIPVHNIPLLHARFVFCKFVYDKVSISCYVISHFLPPYIYYFIFCSLCLKNAFKISIIFMLYRGTPSSSCGEDSAEYCFRLRLYLSLFLL